MAENFIVILADDLGYGDLGCFGSPNIRTPRLDRMATEGIKLTSLYAEPFCGPARAALMTGCYPIRVAEPGNTKSQHPILHTREITVAELLKTRGYATAMIGKWDLAGHSNDRFVAELLPGHQGFDHHFGTPTSNDSIEYTTLLRDGRVVDAPPIDMSTLTRRYVDEAIGFVRANRDRPFFLYLAPNMPHVLLAASRRFRGRSVRGLFGDAVEELDFHIGRLIDALGRLELAERTWVIFASDNGPWLREEANGGSAGAARGGKVTVWEGGMRVPGIVWAPGRVPAGRTLTGMCALQDLFPTVAAIANAEMPGDRTIDGHDLSSWWAGDRDRSPRDRHYFYLWTHLQAVREGRWKLHLPRPFDPEWLRPIRPSQHVSAADAGPLERPLLFDIEADFGERRDRSGDHPEIVRRLLGIAEEARAELGDQDRTGAGVRFFDPQAARPAAPRMRR